MSPEGKLLDDGGKATDWHTSYHEIEHALLNYLYLYLYVDQEPAVLHFRLDGAGGGKKHYVPMVDDPGVGIREVNINGRAWEDFNSQERSVALPDEEDLRVEVILEPGA